MMIVAIKVIISIIFGIEIVVVVVVVQRFKSRSPVMRRIWIVQ